jgi:hypothetical protein
VQDFATGDTLSADSVSAVVTMTLTGSGPTPGTITCTSNGGSGASTSGLVYTHNGTSSTVPLSGCNQAFVTGPFTILFNNQFCGSIDPSGRNVNALIITDGSDQVNVAHAFAGCTNCSTPACRATDARHPAWQSRGRATVLCSSLPPAVLTPGAMDPERFPWVRGAVPGRCDFRWNPVLPRPQLTG